MLTSLARLICILGLFVCCLESGQAIECFSCRGSSDDDACGDKDFTNTNTISDIGNGDECNQCFKVRNDEDGSTLRGCLHITKEVFPNKCFFTDSIPKTAICYCDDDKCNSGLRHTGSLFVAVGTALVVIGRYLW